MMPTDLQGLVNTVASEREVATDLDDIKQFSWEIVSIDVRLQELRQRQAKVLGITEPQWTILLALADLDREDGVPVNVVSKRMHVAPSFVTTQSKLLEKKGFLRRKPSTSDARVVQMSLTDKTYKHLTHLTARQEVLDCFVFGELDHRELTEFMRMLTALRKRLEMALIKFALDF